MVVFQERLLFHDIYLGLPSFFSSLTFLVSSSSLSSQVNKVYAVVSSMTSFYLPLPVMFYVYFRILLIAKSQVKGIRRLQLSLEQNGYLQGQTLHLESIGAECPTALHDTPQSPARRQGSGSGPSGDPVIEDDTGESVQMKRLSTSTAVAQDPQARSVERSSSTKIEATRDRH